MKITKKKILKPKIRKVKKKIKTKREKENINKM